MWNRYTGRWKPEGRVCTQEGLAGPTDPTTGLAPAPALASLPLTKASLTSGGVVGCGHELIAGKTHLWGCQVGTELLWLQLNSKVVLVDSFLGRNVRDHFSLLPSRLVKDKAHQGGPFHLLQKVFSASLPQLKEGLPQFPQKPTLTVRVFLRP